MKSKQVILPLVALVVVSVLAGGYYMYTSQINKEGSPGTFTLSIYYAGIKDNRTLDIEATGQENLFDIMNSNLDIEYETYTGLGHLVTGIDGVVSNVDISNYYWIFYVNGVKSNVGADLVIPAEGDIIQWNYEPFSP